MYLTPVPLTADAFAAFGEVIDLNCAHQLSINGGLTTRFHDLIDIDTADQNGRTLVNVFRTSAIKLPHKVSVMERHPLGSQAFLPVQEFPFLILVAADNSRPNAGDLSLFYSNGEQGINIRKNTWHHFNLVIEPVQDFIVIDRGGDGENLEEIQMEEEIWIPENAVLGLHQ